MTWRHRICAQCWPTFCWNKWGWRPCNGDACRQAIQLNIASRQRRAAANTRPPVPGPPGGPPPPAAPPPAGPPPPGLGTIRTASVILTPGPYAACLPATPTPAPIASVPAAQSPAHGQPFVQMQPPDQDAASNAASSSSGVSGNPGTTRAHPGPVLHQAKYARKDDSPALQATAQAKTEIVETSAQTTTLVTSPASTQTTTLVASPPCHSYQAALNHLAEQFGEVVLCQSPATVRTAPAAPASSILLNHLVLQHAMHQPNLGLARTMPINGNRSDSSSSAGQWLDVAPGSSQPPQFQWSEGGLGGSLPVANTMPRVTVRRRPHSWNDVTIV